MIQVCIHTSSMRGYAFLYALPRYEVWRLQVGTLQRALRYRKIRCSESQFSMELMPFRRGLSVIVRNSEAYVILRAVIMRVVISRVVVSRFAQYAGQK